MALANLVGEFDLPFFIFKSQIPKFRKMQSSVLSSSSQPCTRAHKLLQPLVGSWLGKEFPLQCRM